MGTSGVGQKIPPPQLLIFIQQNKFFPLKICEVASALLKKAETSMKPSSSDKEKNEE
jgi:hypothetical protein